MEAMDVDAGVMDVDPIAPAALESTLPEQPSEIVDADAATLDVEGYLSQYRGLTLVRRAQHIAQHCPSKRVDALTIAHNALTQTNSPNVPLRVIIARDLAQACTASGVAVPPSTDPKLLEPVQQQVNFQREKLEQDLKTHRANNIKESIRMANNDLGDHFFATGDYINASKAYTRARDYCSHGQHILQTCLNMIKCTMAQGNYPGVLTQVTKAEACQELAAQPKLAALLKAISGLAHLASGNARQCARIMTDIPFEHFSEASGALTTVPGVASGGAGGPVERMFSDRSAGERSAEYVTQRDVALYASLCSLAVSTRQEIKRRILDNAGFRPFLEAMPELREVVKAFYTSRYAECLRTLDNLKADLMLDVYLSGQVTFLFRDIRKRALAQYFSPFLSADMNKMAQAFLTDVTSLEEELMALIIRGDISARIDSDKKILYARKANQRTTTFAKALDMGQQFEFHTKAMLARANMIDAHLVVQGKTRMTEFDQMHLDMM